MYKRLVLLKKAVCSANLTELVKDVVRNTARKSHGECSATGTEIRLTGAGSRIQTEDAHIVKTPSSGLLKPTKNILILSKGNLDISANPWLHTFVNDEKNYGCLATTRFGEDGKVGNEYWKRTTKTINETTLNMFAAALTTIGLLLSFATFSSVSAATNPKQETKSEEEREEDSSTMSHFSQESTERMKTETFSFENGTAFRDSEFSYVWRPSNPNNELDLSAAREAARKEAEKKANTFPKKKRPFVIAVVQDSKGNAIGNHSIRGQHNQDKFSKKISSEQRGVLEEIDELERGSGHGKCAEQPLTHNVLVILQSQRRQNLPLEQRMFLGPCTIVAYLDTNRTGTGQFDLPIGACDSCFVTNEYYGFEDQGKNSCKRCKKPNNQCSCHRN